MITGRKFVAPSRKAYEFFATHHNSSHNTSFGGTIAVRFEPRRERIVVYGTILTSRCGSGPTLGSATDDAGTGTLTVRVQPERPRPATSTNESGGKCVPNPGAVAYMAIVTFAGTLPGTVVVAYPQGKQRFVRGSASEATTTDTTK